MADGIRSFFMTPDEPQSQAPRGGLGAEDRGGLAKFVENVGKGLDTVLSHPLYARAWSGMVSGHAQDPMAGPDALQAIKQSGIPSMDDELKALRYRQMKRLESDAEREASGRAALAAALRSGDPRNIESAYAQVDPSAAAKLKLDPPKTVVPKLSWQYNDAGDKRQVWVHPDQRIEPVEGAPWVKKSNEADFAITGYDEQGRPYMQMGGSPIASPTRSGIEKDQIDAQDTASRLDTIRESFRPEFQQWGTKLSQRWRQAKSSAGASLSQEETQQLTDMADFQGSAFETMSYILNQLSGAAISPAEFERLKGFLPNVGAGVFDGDDPVTFQSKLNRFDKSVRLALLRYEYAKQRGLDTGGIPLTESELEKRVGRSAMSAAGFGGTKKVEPATTVDGGSDPRFPEIER